MIKLDINYDPDLPPYMQGPPGFDPNKPRKPRWFKFNGRSVRVWFLEFGHRHVDTRGFDPYAGERWGTEFGPFSIELSSVVCLEVQIRRGKLVVYRACETEWAEMPWWFKLLWRFLEDRREWWEYQAAQEDGYPPLAYWE